MLTDRPVNAPGIETRPMTRDKWLLVGPSLCGGRAYAILERFFRLYEEKVHGCCGPLYEQMEQIAKKAWKKDKKSAFLLRVDTSFMGTREEPERRGRIENLSEDTFTPENLILGIMAGMVQELYGFYEKMEAGTGRRAVRLTGSGNGLRKNRILQEIVEEVFGMKLEMSECREEAAAGAARAAAWPGTVVKGH